MPSPSSTWAGSTAETYELSTRSWVSIRMPRAETRKPVPISSRGGSTFISREPIWVDPVTMPTIIGRKASPVAKGV